MVDNNDILRRLRYAFDYNDSTMMEIFANAGVEASRAMVSDWLKKDNDPDMKSIDDGNLAAFLNGMIIKNRGRKDDKEVINEIHLNNNLILRKLKIALELRDEDMLEVFSLANMRVSKHELSAFFRNPKQQQFRQCKDQYLRNFLQGLQKKYRV